MELFCKAAQLTFVRPDLVDFSQTPSNGFTTRTLKPMKSRRLRLASTIGVRGDGGNQHVGGAAAMPWARISYTLI